MIQLYLFYFLTFALGTIFGSFLNLVSDRTITGESILWGRSRCDFCKKPLNGKSLIPLFSYILQHGKSACCKEKLSWTYPTSELLSGTAFLFAAHYSKLFIDPSLSSTLVFLYVLTILCFYIILFFTDAKYRLLPDKVVFTAIVTTLLFIVTLTVVDLKIYYDKVLTGTLGKYLIQAGFWKNHLDYVAQHLLVVLASSVFISLFFIALILITRGRGMGGGDVKLGFLIGLFNGFPGNILAVFLGFLLGAAYSLVLMVFKKKGIKDTIAFGPFLILGSIIAFIWGESIINWYFGLI